MITLLRQGFPLPPRGWPLWLLLAAFILTGLVGHDPWKNDDAITIGIVYDLLTRGHVLLPHLAGTPFPDAPLFYWSAALTGSLFAGFLPLHDAIRLASGFWVALALWLTGRAAQTAPGSAHGTANTGMMLLAGSLGFLIHAHEAQPMLTALAAQALGLWAALLAAAQGRRATLLFAMATSIAFLGGGLAPILSLLAWIVLPPANGATATNATRRALLRGLLLGSLLPLLWILLLAQAHPQQLALWWATETALWRNPAAIPGNVWAYLILVSWFAWPALPLAAWTIWNRRRRWQQDALRLPTYATLAICAILASTLEARASSGLLLLPAIVLLASHGIPTLRRGGAMAFDWFAVMTFSLFAVLVWIGWFAMAFGWPERLAARIDVLTPGFSSSIAVPQLLGALLVTCFWIWLITSGPRQRTSGRGLTHWLGGLTTFWALLIALWLPWVEYGKSHRGVTAELRLALAAENARGCIAGHNIGLADRAVFDYFADIQLLPEQNPETGDCHWLLRNESRRSPTETMPDEWHAVASAHRPGDRKEHYVLYRRDR